ncbi:hypothetical protein HAX54_040984 [Datura stramonium]|uniref:Uncharacterized protein n=1 Tax=Datura stramonium TaxID=4076 RepID=A0ABS8SKM1_DATST|nr:hypothetical protein [Datura stramonium]
MEMKIKRKTMKQRRKKREKPRNWMKEKVKNKNTKNTERMQDRNIMSIIKILNKTKVGIKNQKEMKAKKTEKKMKIKKKVTTTTTTKKKMKKRNEKLLKKETTNIIAFENNFNVFWELDGDNPDMARPIDREIFDLSMRLWGNSEYNVGIEQQNQQEHYYYYDDDDDDWAAAGKPIAVCLQETQDCTRPSTARVKPNSEANNMEQLKGDVLDFLNAKRVGKKDTEKPVGEGNMGQQLAENINSNKENSLAR